MDSSINKSIYIVNKLKKLSIKYVICVPCVNLKNIINTIQKDNTIKYITITREEEGVGIASGIWFGGKRAILLMQNSGLGNCINALMSLNRLYKIPLIMIMSHRGIENEKMVGQIPMGLMTCQLLDSLKIKYYEFNELLDIENVIENAFIKNEIIAILIKPSYWE